MQGTMPGARRRRIPHTAWMDNIKTWTGLSVEESVRMTEDRDKSRKYVHGQPSNRGRLKNRTELLLCPSNGLFSRTTWLSRYQKGRTSLDLSEARDDGVWGCSGISWTTCKQSAPRSRQIATPTIHHSIFTVRMLFLTPNQQRQSIEGSYFSK